MGGRIEFESKIEDKIVAMKLRDDKKNTKSHANSTIRHEIEMNSTENETHPTKQNQIEANRMEYKITQDDAKYTGTQSKKKKKKNMKMA